jgi:flagellar biosynthesis/type III secretory pathway ATPase
MAMRLMPGIIHFLRQDMNSPQDLTATWDQLRQLLGGA